MTDGRADRLTEVLADLAREGDQLDALVAPLDEDAWGTPTPAEGWAVKHQVAHLAWTDEVAVAAATDKQAWDRVVLAAMENPTASSTPRRRAGHAHRTTSCWPAGGPRAPRWHAPWRPSPRARSCRGSARR